MRELFTREFLKTANMAGNSVQEIVNAVLTNLNRSPQQENSLETAASTSNGNEVSVTSQLNRAFRIPQASTSANVQAIFPSTVASIRAVARNFSATSNY